MNSGLVFLPALRSCVRSAALPRRTCGNHNQMTISVTVPIIMGVRARLGKRKHTVGTELHPFSPHYRISGSTLFCKFSFLQLLVPPAALRKGNEGTKIRFPHTATILPVLHRITFDLSELILDPAPETLEPGSPIHSLGDTIQERADY